ncbi:cytochrome c oxidase subunit II [Gracilibacillus caseinilyticus]|uniref:Cytochrome c oxidase subunit II n=1 Tax=Gracilibacillus caseinilyticus TaxID=2932256 RepID=A0ABY4ERW1_9BACI|nr:cytochrome c oxidase subunit II [Gracilibacillus caseinilyticus]UOQ47085.1 cytochrome c oxidase subunit II [Gracilibacillus caseinilyticus]
MKSCIYLLFITSLLVSGCDIRVLNPQSDTAEAQSNLIYFSFLLMLLVLIVVFVMMFRFVSKYREEKVSYEIPKQEEGNRKLELTWTILPVVLLIILAVPTVIVTFNQSPNGDVQTEKYKDAVHIKVTAKRYEWQFTYPNGKKTVNELFLPANKTVR